MNRNVPFFVVQKWDQNKVVSNMNKMKRLLSLALCLGLLLALAPQAVAEPALRAYCYNFQVTSKDGVPTGFSFNMGAQYGTQPYKLSYVISGGASMTGTITSGNYASVPGDFASGEYTIEVTATDAASATSTAKMVVKYTRNEDNSYDRTILSSVAPEAVKVTKLTPDKSAVTLGVSETAQLTVAVEPADASNKKVTYASSNAAVATVSDAGLITGVKAGSAIITITAADGSGITATTAVTVVQHVQGISLTPAAAALAKGGNLTLSPVITPSDATNPSVTFSSSNTAVAVVSNSGIVTGVSNGQATITAASVDDPTKTASCTVTVGTPVTGISLSLSAASLETGKTLSLVASVTPEDATNKQVKWTSSDPSVASVNEAGLVSTWKAGTATITATAADGSGVSAGCTVSVSGAEVTPPATPTPTPTPTVTPTNTGSVITPTPTQQIGPAGQIAYVHTEKGGLNLRTATSQNAKRIAIIPENGSFTIVTYGTTWCYVWYDGLYGYVMTKFVSLTPPDKTPTPVGPTPTPAPDVPTGTTAFVFTEKGSLNLREGASQNAKVLRTIPENGTFTVITYGKTWCYAYYKGTYGYVMTKFVRLAGETTMPSGNTTPAPVIPTTVPTATPGLSGNQARVTTPKGDLNMRKGPSTNDGRVTLIPRNAIVEVLTYGKTWCYVRYDGKVGYVMTKFLTLSPDIGTIPVPATPSGATYAQVATEQGGLNLRIGAGLSYERIHIIPQYATVQVLTYGPTWCFVTYNNTTGYVMTKFLVML